MEGCPVLIRYADDLVVLCHTRQDALEVKARLAAWLAPRGLAFNEDKTRVVSLDEGFDFLGFNVRRYGTKLLIKPSKAAIRRIRERLRTELRSLRGSNAPGGDQTAQPDHPGVGRLLPDTGIQRRVQHSWTTTCGGSPTSGPGTATRTSRSPGSSPGTTASSTSPGRTDGCSATAKRRLHAQVLLDQHPPAPDRQAGASPDDPALADYWAWRRRKARPPINKTTQELLNSQDGRCAICEGACSPSRTGRRTRASGSSG